MVLKKTKMKVIVLVVTIHMESKNTYNSMQKAIVVWMHAVAFLLAAYDVTFFYSAGRQNMRDDANTLGIFVRNRGMI